MKLLIYFLQNRKNVYELSCKIPPLRNILDISKCTKLIQNNQYANFSIYLSKLHISNILYKSQSSFQNYCTRFQYYSTKLPEKTNQSLLLVKFPNPFLWMKMKWRFKKLNYFWDPEFNEEDFLRGAKQALVTITHLIGENNFDELKGLLTKDALQKLRQEVTLTWPQMLRQNISLSNHHIKAITPINIRMMENIKNGRKFCDVDILYIALKRITHNDKKNYILIFNILSRFHRNYTEGAIPEWTVAIFTMDVVAHKPAV